MFGAAFFYSGEANRYLNRISSSKAGHNVDCLSIKCVTFLHVEIQIPSVSLRSTLVKRHLALHTSHPDAVHGMSVGTTIRAAERLHVTLRTGRETQKH